MLLWDTLVRHFCHYADTLAGLVGHSCGDTRVVSCATLLRDTLLGHSRTTLTYSDVIWPYKLTILRPQLPKAAPCTTFVLPNGQF